MVLFIHRPLLLSSCIFPEDEKSETVCQSIIDCIQEKALLLDKWRAIHEKEFGCDSHDIPHSENMGLYKFQGASVNSDTCNAARLTTSIFVDKIEEAVKEKMEIEGIDPSSALVLQQDCHHHLRNVWIGAITKNLSKYLDEVLKCDLEEIDNRYRVSTMMDSILRAVDKEFSLPANYPKGHGDMFKHWLKKHHPGALLVPVERATGSRQDLACEGAGAVYWNRRCVFLCSLFMHHYIITHSAFIFIYQSGIMSNF